MNWSISIPVFAEDRPRDVKDIGEIAAYLNDPEDRAVCRELLTTVALRMKGGEFSLAGVAEALESLTPPQRRKALDKFRQAADLTSVEDEQHKRYLATRVPDRRDLELVVMPGGALVSRAHIEDETRRQQERAASLARKRQAQAAEGAVEAEHRRQREEAEAEELRRLTPHGVLP